MLISFFRHFRTMSSFIVIGFFALTAGRDIAIPKQVGDRSFTSHYHHYTTVVQTSNYAIPAELRMFATREAVIHANNTIAFVIAHASVDSSNVSHPMILLETNHIAHVPGDPNDSQYEEMVPDMVCPIIVALGTQCPLPPSTNITSNMFSLAVADYVRDSNQRSQIM